MTELASQVNVTKRKKIIGCALESFETSKPYATNQTIEKTFNCVHDETLLYAFNRFKTFDDADYLTMINNDGMTIFSKSFSFVHNLINF